VSLTCHQCPVEFSGEQFRIRHEQVVHGVTNPLAVQDSPTSVAAAEEIRGSASRLRERVYEYLQSQGYGATDERIQEALAMNPSTQRPRRVELVVEGRVRNSGRQSKTKSGRWAVVWEVVR